MKLLRLALPIAAASLCAMAQPAAADGIYFGGGFPLVMLGYAHPVSPSVTLRGDLATTGNRTDTRNEQGITYSASLKTSRSGLFADWFMVGGLRLTGGLTFNQMRVDLRANGSGGSLTIGNTTFATSVDDYFNVGIRFPNTTPYLGIGWGHQLGSGVGLVADIGASFGRAKLSESHGGPSLSAVSQADIDAELAQLRDGVGKVRMMPQLTLGMSIRF